MHDKLRQLEIHYEGLNRQLSDPEVVQDQRRFRTLSKEHADLTQVVETYRQFCQLEEEIAGHRDVLAGDDSELAELAKEELGDLENRHAVLAHQLKLLLMPKDPNDEKNIILELRSGTGGDEAALFAGELFRMYSNYATDRGWKVEVMSSSPGPQGGLKEVIALIQGDGAYSHLKFESGVHRVQRVPATESQGRIHTSAVTVAVLPEAEDIDIDVADKDLRIDVYRSSGPGGQSVNTTDSAVRITHLPTSLVVTCQDEKSQHKNKAKAMRILRARLLDLRQAEEDAKRAEQRRGMVKSGDRSEKIRTYNFPQDRLTDHRIGYTAHNLPAILQGRLGDLVTTLQNHHQAEVLQRQESENV